VAQVLRRSLELKSPDLAQSDGRDQLSPAALSGPADPQAVRLGGRHRHEIPVEHGGAFHEVLAEGDRRELKQNPAGPDAALHGLGELAPASGSGTSSAPIGPPSTVLIGRTSPPSITPKVGRIVPATSRLVLPVSGEVHS